MGKVLYDLAVLGDDAVYGLKHQLFCGFVMVFASPNHLVPSQERHHRSGRRLQRVHQLVAVPWDPWGSEKSWFYRTLLDPFRVDDVDDDDDGDDGDDDDDSFKHENTVIEVEKIYHGWLMISSGGSGTYLQYIGDDDPGRPGIPHEKLGLH